MAKKNKISLFTEIPKSELKDFDKLIKSYRKKYIRTSQIIVDEIFDRYPYFVDNIKAKKISKSISELRTLIWSEYLEDEVNFNVKLVQDLYQLLDTPKEIINTLIDDKVISLKGKELKNEIIKLCGEYAGRIYPYIYRISLSTTQSRRSRAGKTFESIMYKVYDILDYPFDSQSKVGRKTFNEMGLGKKVDSVLPSIQAYSERRSKIIIGTMKTSLRERWQEVAEEIERTNLPSIHLLTVDEDITLSKAQEMNHHNITIVVYDWVAYSKELNSMKNIISFEDYLFEEIPDILKYWYK